jgi:hypothetical protein
MRFELNGASELLIDELKNLLKIRSVEVVGAGRNAKHHKLTEGAEICNREGREGAMNTLVGRVKTVNNTLPCIDYKVDRTKAIDEGGKKPSDTGTGTGKVAIIDVRHVHIRAKLRVAPQNTINDRRVPQRVGRRGDVAALPGASRTSDEVFAEDEVSGSTIHRIIVLEQVRNRGRKTTPHMRSVHGVEGVRNVGGKDNPGLRCGVLAAVLPGQITKEVRHDVSATRNGSTNLPQRSKGTSNLLLVPSNNDLTSNAGEDRANANGPKVLRRVLEEGNGSATIEIRPDVGRQVVTAKNRVNEEPKFCRQGSVGQHLLQPPNTQTIGPGGSASADGLKHLRELIGSNRRGNDVRRILLITQQGRRRGPGVKHPHLLSVLLVRRGDLLRRKTANCLGRLPLMHEESSPPKLGGRQSVNTLRITLEKVKLRRQIGIRRMLIGDHGHFGIPLMHVP